MCVVLTAAHGSLDHSFVLRLPISFTACFHLVEVSGAPAQTKKVREITYCAKPTLKNLGIERALFENVKSTNLTNLKLRVTEKLRCLSWSFSSRPCSGKKKWN